jgi:hypothetical protein
MIFSSMVCLTSKGGALWALQLKILSADSYTGLRFSRASHEMTTLTSSLEDMKRQRAMDGGAMAAADGGGNGNGKGVEQLRVGILILNDIVK